MRVRVVAIDIANNAEIHEETHHKGPIWQLLLVNDYVIVGRRDGSTIQYIGLDSPADSGPGEWPEDP